MTLGAFVWAGVVSVFLLPRARDAAAAGELAGAGLVLGFWGAAVASIAGAAWWVGWLGAAVMVAAAGALVVESGARRIGRGAKR